MSQSGSGRIAQPFLGQWHSYRRTVDFLERRTVVFRGVATITPGYFSETGDVIVNGQRMSARRRYRLDLSDETVSVSFEDGRPFVRIDGSPRQVLTHLCGEDSYRGLLLFADRERWLELWRVAGPRKRYISLGRYTRIG